MDDTERSSYAVGNLTCHILPGGHAREYIYHANVSLLNWTDLVYVSLVSGLFRLVLLPYFDSTEYLLYVYCILIVLIWIWIKHHVVKYESILAVRDIGVQVQTVYLLGRRESLFIDRHKIDDIIINEGITMWQIKSYLAILVKEQDRMIVVFQNLLPRLRPVLLEVYNGTRSILFPHAAGLNAIKQNSA
ncbi:hypothetical protein VTP01DRAFT_7530 [Rhizomucor pusillus]|uniref:uncharacterized protein n=1 Tax=Rhizomucor pusillus TaxID=4840 RepID=UPI00374403EB